MQHGRSRAALTPRLAARRSGRRGATAALLAVVVALAASLIGVHAARQALAPEGSIDLHAYWYAGHFLRQGDNPYTAFVLGRQPRVPDRYLDGPARSGSGVRQGDLSITPSNAAPVVLLLAPSAWLTWPTAKELWLIANLMLAIAVPVLILGLVPRVDKWPPGARTAFVLAFLFLQGTRITIWVGQTTLLVLAFALVAVHLRDRRPWVSGLLLGVALSKYSLIAPTWIFMIASRRLRVAVVAAAVQCVALAAVAALGTGGMRDTLAAYAVLGRLHAGLPGIHLGGLYPATPWLGAVLSAALTVAVVAVLWRHRARWRGPVPLAAARVAAGELTLGELHALAALFLWGLLVVYHRAYDDLAAYVFVAVMGAGMISEADPWGLAVRGRRALVAFAAFVTLVLAMPPSALAVVLSPTGMEAWYRLAGMITTATLAAATMVILVLMTRLAPPGDHEPHATPRRAGRGRSRHRPAQRGRPQPGTRGSARGP